MQYITINDGSFILKVGGSTKTFSIKSFNYHKIKRAIKEERSEEFITSLMKTPSLPEGVYELYSKGTRLYATQYKDTEEPIIHIINSGQDNALNTIYESKTAKKFLGVYESLKAIKEDWPEFFL